MGKTILAFAVGALTAAAAIFAFDVPLPARWFETSDPKIVIDREAFDPIWAPAAARALSA